MLAGHAIVSVEQRPLAAVCLLTESPEQEEGYELQGMEIHSIKLSPLDGANSAQVR